MGRDVGGVEHKSIMGGLMVCWWSLDNSFDHHRTL